MKIPAYTYTHITERGLYALKPQETKTEFIRLRISVKALVAVGSGNYRTL
jgi:hypothetical protein